VYNKTITYEKEVNDLQYKIDSLENVIQIKKVIIYKINDKEESR
jgi:hypothetical protein